jgi:phosphatidate cytidylyltransferase
VDKIMLWQRILTALVLIPIAILAIAYLPNIYFGFATAFLLAAVAWEWSKLAGISGNKQRIIYVAVVLGAIDIASDIPPILTLVIGAMAWFGALYFVCRYPNINKKIFIGWRGCLISVLLLAPCWVGLNVLRTYGTKYIFAVLFMIWAADTGAYFAGRAFGRHKLASKVSPKKTIEGLVGGMLLALIVYNGCFLYFASGWIGLLKWIVWEMLIVNIN